MRIAKVFREFTLLAVFLSLSCVKRKFNSDTRKNSVEIPMTKVQDQGVNAFCGSFAMTAFLEGIAAQHTGHKVDLSEMFIAYHVMARNMYKETLRISYLPDEEKKKAYEKLVADLNIPEQYTYFQGVSIQDVLDIVSKYGIVPKDKFQRVFGSDKIAKTGIFELHRRFLQKFSDPDKEVALKEILDDILPNGIFFPTAAPKIFALENSVQTTTPLDYLNTLGFNSGDYKVVRAGLKTDPYGRYSRSDNFDAMIQSVKGTLAAKSPAVLATSVDVERWLQIDSDRKYTNDFSAPYWTNLDRNHGHMVAAIDFVNRGGRQGSMTAEELKREVETSAPANKFFP